MKFIIAICLAAFVSNAMAADTLEREVRPIFKPKLLGLFYTKICEGPLGGVYVNSRPNFIQTWACEGINWCEVRPETIGCNR